MVNNSPSRSSTVVCARRTVNPGTEMPETITDVDGSMAETSGLMSIFIRPSRRIVGVKPSEMPTAYIGWLRRAPFQHPVFLSGGPESGFAAGEEICGIA